MLKILQILLIIKRSKKTTDPVNHKMQKKRQSMRSSQRTYTCAEQRPCSSVLRGSNHTEPTQEKGVWPLRLYLYLYLQIFSTFVLPIMILIAYLITKHKWKKIDNRNWITPFTLLLAHPCILSHYHRLKVGSRLHHLLKGITL